MQHLLQESHPLNFSTFVMVLIVSNFLFYFEYFLMTLCLVLPTRLQVVFFSCFSVIFVCQLCCTSSAFILLPNCFSLHIFVSFFQTLSFSNFGSFTATTQRTLCPWLYQLSLLYWHLVPNSLWSFSKAKNTNWPPLAQHTYFLWKKSMI